jgi:hypothetical protein
MRFDPIALCARLDKRAAMALAAVLPAAESERLRKSWIDLRSDKPVQVTFRKTEPRPAAPRKQETSMTEVEKALALQSEINKTVTASLDALAEKIQKKTGCDWNAALLAAINDPVISALHKAEKAAKFGIGY